jgi:hypothetical protein
MKCVLCLLCLQYATIKADGQATTVNVAMLREGLATCDKSVTHDLPNLLCVSLLAH